MKIEECREAWSKEHQPGLKRIFYRLLGSYNKAQVSLDDGRPTLKRDRRGNCAKAVCTWTNTKIRKQQPDSKNTGGKGSSFCTLMNNWTKMNQCPDHYAPVLPPLSAHLTHVSCRIRACSSSRSFASVLWTCCGVFVQALENWMSCSSLVFGLYCNRSCSAHFCRKHLCGFSVCCVLHTDIRVSWMLRSSFSVTLTSSSVDYLRSVCSQEETCI